MGTTAEVERMNRAGNERKKRGKEKWIRRREEGR